MSNIRRDRPSDVKKLVVLGLLAAALGTAGLLRIPAARGQEIAVRTQKPLLHEVTVGLKLVQVYVTDKKGKPVTDLERGDFTVTDNGQPVPITDFERHVLTPPPAVAVAPAPVPAPASAAEKPALGRKFFLFIDFAFNSPRGVLKAKQAALSFLDKDAAEGDEVGLISYSVIKGLTIHEFLTTDRAKVRKAVDDLSVKASAGRADDVEQEYWRLATQGSTAADLSRDVSVRRQDARSQARAFILNVTALAKAFRYIPGHKNLLLFSTGIASSLIYGKAEGTPQGSSGVADRSKFEAPDRVLVEDYEALFQELGASNSSIFSFDTRETAKPASLFDYDDQTFGSGHGSRDIFSAGGVAQNPSTVYKSEDVTGLYALSKLSNSTGGRYFGNINEYQGNLADLQSMTGSYYVLGYSIGQTWDGAFHEIKVEVARQGLDVRTQKGYFNPKPFTEFSTVEKTLHLLDLALSDAPIYQAPLMGNLQALAGPGEPGTGKDRVVLLARLPSNTADRLTGAKAEIVTFVFDAEDHLTDMRRAEEAMAGFLDKSIFYATSVALAPGEYSCRIVVRDLETGAAAIASCKAYVPAPVPAGLRLHTPLLLGPAAESVYREGRLAAGPRTPVAWTSLYPFDPAEYDPIPGALSNAVPALRVVLPMTNFGPQRDRVAFRAALLSTETAERFGLTITPVASAAAGGTVIQTFDIATLGLNPGRYTLYFYAEDKPAGTLAHVTAPLVIR
ncbi:MAG: VWA domain-containing protein [Acidobacteriota bacterium]|nr:VWA domain-containing protein [Acidobacteriota bacterium]